MLDTSASALAEGTIGNLQTYMQNNLTFISNADLLTALSSLESSGGAANENIVIGKDSGDTIVITGNLQVSGTTTTVDSTTVTLNDHNIVLDSGNSTSAVVDGAGITLEGGTGNDVTWMWSASLAELVHHMKAELTLPQIRRAIYIFSRNMQDNTLPLSTHMTCARLMHHLVESIFRMRANSTQSEEVRAFLVRILYATVAKFRTLRTSIPELVETANDLEKAIKAKAAPP